MCIDSCVHSILFGIIYLFSGVNSQAVSGITANGETYICLVTGTPCPTSNGTTSPGNTIDPRIIIPGPLCPSGTFPCYGRATPCGRRLLNITNTADGESSNGAYPWQAYLRNATHAFSGSGVLIDPFHVLTAAHKVYLSQARPTDVIVRMGVWNPANPANTQSSTVANIKVHENFNASTLINDIAVLTLSQPIVLGIYPTINTICLPSSGTPTQYVGQTCVVSGWGQTAFTINDAPTNPQKQVTVGIVPYTVCRTSYSNAALLGNNVDRYLDPNGEICAGGQTMKDACTQDGGSPLVCPGAGNVYSLAGLVIWGKNCGQTGVYGVYVNVPSYLQWITSNLGTTAG